MKIGLTFHHEFLDDLAKLLHVVLGEVFVIFCCLEPLVGPSRLLEPRGPWDGNGDLCGHDDGGSEDEGGRSVAVVEVVVAVVKEEEEGLVVVVVVVAEEEAGVLVPSWLLGGAAPERRPRTRST